MKPENAKEFELLMMETGEVYDLMPSKAKIAIYFRSLHGISLEKVKEAFQIHIEDQERGRFFPKPADIIYAYEGTGPQYEKYIPEVK